MNDGIDETTEYLLEEYALDRLSGEGRVRVEELLRATPSLRARVKELRGEAQLLSSTLVNSAREGAEEVPDTVLAMLLDGSLDELERATLEASLAGDLQSQARLAALYREANAVINDEPFPERAAPEVSVADIVIPLAPAAPTRTVSLNDGAVVVASLLTVASFFTPRVVAVPILFLALGFFAWWAVHTPSDQRRRASARRRSALGVLPALIMFVAGLFSGTYSIWCYVLSVGWYWYWLVQRIPLQAVSDEGKAQVDDVTERRHGAG